jgi:hypothetical protein
LNNSIYELDQVFNDEKADVMIEIRRMTIHHNLPLIQKSKRYRTYQVIENSIGNDDDIEFVSYACTDNDDYNNSCPMVLGSSQVGFSMSQSRLDEYQSQEFYPTAQTIESYSNFHTLYPLFLEMVSAIKDDESLRFAQAQIKKMTYDNIHKSRKSITSRPNGGTTFLGEKSERRKAGKNTSLPTKYQVGHDDDYVVVMTILNL